MEVLKTFTFKNKIFQNLSINRLLGFFFKKMNHLKVIIISNVIKIFTGHFTMV